MKKIFFLMGQTATGKTELTMKLYKYLPIEVISIDSVAVYRLMNIGTSKPKTKELELVPHRLINICDPDKQYSLFQFYKDVISEIKSIIKLNKIPFLVGGTMLYFKSIIDGVYILPQNCQKIKKYIENQVNIFGYNELYRKLMLLDPKNTKKIHINDKRRLFRRMEILLLSKKQVNKLENSKIDFSKYKIYKFAIIPPEKKNLEKRIQKRFFKMLENGLQEEVKEIFIKNKIKDNLSSIRSIGYYQMWKYLCNQISHEQMIHDAIKATKNLAKHQMTWMKKWSDINWINTNDNINKIVEKIYTLSKI